MANHREEGNVSLKPTVARGTTTPSQQRPAALIVVMCTIGSAEATCQAFSGIKADSPAAFVVLSAMRRGFSRLLCDRMRSIVNLSVQELTGVCKVEQGGLYVVPAQVLAQIRSDGPECPLELLAAEPENPNILRSRATTFAEQVARLFAGKAVGVLLSGIGEDAVNALARIKSGGGRTIAQDEATAIVFDACRAAAEQKIADETLPLWGIGSRLDRLVEEL